MSGLCAIADRLAEPESSRADPCPGIDTDAGVAPRRPNEASCPMHGVIEFMRRALVVDFERTSFDLRRAA